MSQCFLCFSESKFRRVLSLLTFNTITCHSYNVREYLFILAHNTLHVKLKSHEIITLVEKHHLPILMLVYFFLPGDSIQWWTEDDGAFEYRLAGSFLEWIMAILMIIFVVSYTNEFKTLQFQQINFRCKFPDISNVRSEENGKRSVENGL